MQRLTARGVRVVAFSASDDVVIRARCLEAGAVAFVNKAERFDVLAGIVGRVVDGEQVTNAAELDDLAATLRAARADEASRLAPFTQLTRREQEVLGALMAGHSAHDIARDTVVSIKTVRSQIDAIHRKLGVRSQLAAVALARKAGWTPPSPRAGP